MAEIAVVIFIMVMCMLLITVVNVFGVGILEKDVADPHAPLVSILVPARNEEHNIGRCLLSLMQQDYPNKEIIILDDQSTDDTRNRAEETAGGNPFVRVVRGRDLPSGWTGKNFACHQLAQEARGELLLFTDADTVHAPWAVSAAVLRLRTESLGLLSVIPHQTMQSFWERTFMPLLHFVTFTLLPFPLIRLMTFESLAMANGQFLLFDRQAYDRVGGHASVRSAIVEDVLLARRIKRSGAAMNTIDGGRAVSCRMYSSLRDIWRGFSKNIFPGLGYSVPLLILVVLGFFLTSVYPFLAIMWFNWQTEGTWFLLFSIIGILIIRILLAVRFRTSFETILLHPFAVMLLIAIAINSLRWSATVGSLWKGRAYTRLIKAA